MRDTIYSPVRQAEMSTRIAGSSLAQVFFVSVVRFQLAVRKYRNVLTFVEVNISITVCMA